MQKTTTFFIAVVLILVTLGVLALSTASSVEMADDASYYVRQQLMWLGISFVAACVAARFDYRKYQQLAIPLAVFFVVLLILVLIPGVGSKINGSRRWINLHFANVQPSEFSKIGVVIFFSWWLSRHQRRIDELVRGIVIPFVCLAIFCGLYVAEPDIGTTMLVAATVICMMFVGGVSFWPLASCSFMGLTFVVVLICCMEERRSRILAFLNPQKYETGKAWQLVNSLRAFASGEGGGVGFGNSTQKLDYLPEAYTDFIFPIIGEEFGLVASLLVVIMYVAFFALGLRIAIQTKDDFGRMLAYGITFLITIQALINFAVVSGCAPTKGLALPFISYGGSSLLVCSILAGIMVNIGHVNAHLTDKKGGNPFKDRKQKV